MSDTTWPPEGDLITRAVLVSEAVEGFDITIDGGGSTFSVGPGTVRFVNTLPNGTATIQTLHFDGQSGITPAFADSNNFITIDRTTTLDQMEFLQSYTELNDFVVVGQVITTPGFTPFEVNNAVVVGSSNIPGALFDLQNTTRPLRKDGIVITHSGNNDLKVKHTAGAFLSLMIGGLATPANPNLFPATEFTYSSYIYVSRDGAGGFTNNIFTEIQPEKIDDDTALPTTMTDGFWSVQSIYFLNNTSLVVQYGQYEYCTAENALLGLRANAFCKFPPIDQGAFIGYLLVQKGTTNLGDSTKALFMIPQQVNGEYGVVVTGDVATGDIVTNAINLDQGNVNDIIFCPEYKSFSMESEVFTTSNSWVNALTTSPTLEGGDYIFHYSAEIFQSKASKEVGYRFTVGGVTHGESIDGLSIANRWQMRAGQVELNLSAGSHTIEVDFGQTTGTGIGGIRRIRVYLEKKRK